MLGHVSINRTVCKAVHYGQLGRFVVSSRLRLSFALLLSYGMLIRVEPCIIISCLCVFVPVYVYVCVCVYMCMCMCMCLYVCVCVSDFVGVCLCVHVYSVGEWQG